MKNVLVISVFLLSQIAVASDVEERQYIEKVKAIAKEMSERDKIWWNILDGYMFSGDWGESLNSRFYFKFENAVDLISKKKKGSRDITYLNSMQDILRRAESLYKMIQLTPLEKPVKFNIKKDFAGFKAVSAQCRSLKGNKVELKTIYDVEGIPMSRIISRPINDDVGLLQKLAENAWANYKKNGEAVKHFNFLYDAHPKKSDEEIFNYAFACLLFTFKEFKKSKEVLAEIKTISTTDLQVEIKLLEPQYNKRELTKAVEKIKGMVKREDFTKLKGYLKRLKEYFGACAQWPHFKKQIEETAKLSKEKR